MKKQITTGAILLFLWSCSTDQDKPGYEYMPDMVYSVAYEPYSSNPIFADSMSARVPVKGTIPKYTGAVGHEAAYMPYHYPNNKEGYVQASEELKNPLPADEGNLAEGKRLYGIYCAVCHGPNGEADGPIVANGKFPPPPSFMAGSSTRGGKMLDLTEGKVYHTIMYGLNMMGSYATQLDMDQRWKVVQYIKSLQKNYTEANAPKSDTTAVAQK